MTQKNKSNNDNIETPNDENCLQLSAKLDQAIATLRTLPEFREMAREKGEDAATMAALKLLKETRPELFHSKNPADGIAALFAGMD